MRRWAAFAALMVPIAVVAGCRGRDASARTRARAAALAAPAVRRDRESYDDWRQPARLVEDLALAPGDRVADVGAGRGYLEPYLARAIAPGGHIVATDIDPGALAALGALARRERLPVETRLVGRADPGLEAHAYDLVLLAEVDHLLADRAAYFRRLVPALAPGGRIAIENRIDREPAVRAAAAAAGLDVVATHHDLPSQFVLLLAPRVKGSAQ